jgi:hypothetical protein
MTEASPGFLPIVRIDPMVGIPDDVLARLGGTRVTMEDLQPGALDPFRLVESRAQPCAATRDLLGAIQFCDLEHHTDNWAHRMTNPDGSVTTWRS